MFKLVKTDTFSSTVYVSLPTNDPAKRQEGSFTAKFKRIKKSATDELLTQLKAGEIDDEGVLNQVLVSIEGIGNDDGVALDAESQMQAVLSDFGLTQAVAVAFFRDMGNAAEKNSAKSSRR